MFSIKQFLLFLGLIVFALSCAKQAPKTQAEREREEAFPDMSFESASPKRKASIKLTEDGLRESKNGLNQRAMRKYEQAIDVDPTNPYAYFHYGVEKMKSRDFDQSQRLFDEAREKFGANDKWHSKIYTYQGINYKNMGRIDKAREYFKKALELDKKNVQAMENLQLLGE